MMNKMQNIRQSSSPVLIMICTMPSIKCPEMHFFHSSIAKYSQSAKIKC